MAPKGMVTCPHALASQAGVDVLRAGGSAVDAAIATSAALAVIYPHMTGLGGDAFWLIYDAKTGAVRHLDGGGRAAACASIDWFSQRGMAEVPFRGVLPATLTTPGAVASWDLAHEAYGQLPLQQCLQSAIHYARDGFPVTERLAGWIESTRAELAAHAESAAIFLPGGQVPAAGSLLRNADLARTLEAVAARARPASTAARWALNWPAFRRQTAASSRKPTWPPSARIGASRCRAPTADVTLYETPAPTQGFTVLQMLNLLEPFELHKHAVPEPRPGASDGAGQAAGLSRPRPLSRRPAFVDVPMERLISKSHADQRRALMDPARALPWDRVPSHGSLTGDTVYIAVGRRRGQRGLADPQPVRRVRLGGRGRQHRRGAAEPQRLLLARPPAPQPARTRQDAAAHADRLAGLPERQAVERGGLHGRRRPAADPPADLHQPDRPRPATSSRRWKRRAGCPAALRWARRATRCTSRPGSLRPPSTSWNGAATCSTAGATGTNWPGTRTASSSTLTAACATAAATRAATGRQQGTEHHWA